MTEARFRVPHAVRLRHSRDKVQGEETDPGRGGGRCGVGGRRRGDLFGLGLFPVVAVLVAAPLCLSKLTELYTKMGGSHNM